jgi:hypothetical protein
MTGLVDAHFHIWRQADLPWLMGPMQPRIFGPYEPIRHDDPVEECAGFTGSANRKNGGADGFGNQDSRLWRYRA